MMEKIVLINPNFESPFIYKNNDIRDSPGIPRGILCIGTYLKQNGYDIKIIDRRLSENTLEYIKQEAKDALWIGISVMTSQIRDALMISDELKKNLQVPIVWGGIHPTLFPEQTCKDNSVDFVIFEEGEETSLELANEFKNKEKDFSKIGGLVYKKDGNVIKNNGRDYLNLDKMPNLDFDLIDIERYIWRTLPGTGKKQRRLPVISSRGCPHRCGFCFHVLCNDTKYRTKSVDRTIEEIKELIRRYNIDSLLFAEDNFFVQRKRVIEICNRIIEEGIRISWRAECRADYFRQGFVDDELLKLISDAGCKNFTVGAESGSQRILDIMTKDITVQNIINCAQQCNKYGISPSFSFITGLPGEEKKDVRLTINLIKKLRKMCPNCGVAIGIFRPYPGGHLYKTSFETAKLENPKTLRDWIDKGYVKLMSLSSDIPWNKNSRYMQNAVFYCRMFFFCTKESLLRYIERNPILGLGFSVFVLTGTARVYLNFFSLPIEKHLFNYILKKMKIVLPT